MELFAQMNISTNLRQDGVWNEEDNEWSILSKDEEAITFFEFNKDFTMFKHTTATITSGYIIKSQKKDEESKEIELEIVSDVGNKYLMIIDLKDYNLRFLYKRDGNLYMVHHTIKKVWYDDDEKEEDNDINNGSGGTGRS